MSILLLCDFFLPNQRATGISIQPVLRKLHEHKHNVFVLCVKSRFSESKSELLNGNTVKRTFLFSYWIHQTWLDQKNSGKRGFVRICAALCQKALDAVYGYNKHFQKFRASFSCKRMKNAALRIIKEKQISCILSVSAPFSSHQLASMLKQRVPELRWVAFEMDPYTYNLFDNYETPESKASLEKKVFQNVDVLISQKEIDDYNQRNGLRNGISQRVYQMIMPNMRLHVCPHKTGGKSTDPISLIYTGGLDSIYRSPQKLFEILSVIPEGMVVLHLYGYDHGMFTEAYPDIKNKVILHGQVTKDECDKAVDNADILVNIGNAVYNQTPSKLFDYMGTGKPIVNFSYSEEDTSLWYLKHYGLFLNIGMYEETSSALVGRFINFCQKNRGTALSEKMLTKRMLDFLSDSVSSRIVEIIESTLEN